MNRAHGVSSQWNRTIAVSPLNPPRYADYLGKSGMQSNQT